MTTDDFLLCTFQGDTQDPPANWVAVITAIDAGASSFECKMTGSGDLYTFSYSQDPWTGKDAAGAEYVLASHFIYTGGKTDPAPGNLAIVTFGDNNRFLGYVNSVDPAIEVQFYHSPAPMVTIENNSVTKSDWDQYPAGSEIASIEGCVENTDLPASGTTDTAADGPKQPFLFVDVYEFDVAGKPAWNVLVNTPGYYGAIIKATEGTYYDGGAWFKKNWPAVRDAGGDRYGRTWFRGAYHFLKFNIDGAKQADYYLNAINSAGGWDAGDIIPVIDVELGNDGSKDPSKRNSNQDATAQQIIDCTTACAERIRSVTGRRIMLYGRGAMRDKGISDRMGCDIVWNPCYTPTIVMHGLEAWTLDDVALWQYCGDGVAQFDKLPHSVPNFGAVDISVYIDGANKPTFDSLISRLGIGTT